MPKPVTPQSLSKSPGAYIPMLSSILRKQESISLNLSTDEAAPRLFSLAPLPSLKWRFITINSNVLAAFSGKRLPSTYEEKLNMFNQVFNLKRFKIDRYIDIILVL